MTLLKSLKVVGLFLAGVVGFAAVCAGGLYTVHSASPVSAIPKGTLQEWGILGRLEVCDFTVDENGETWATGGESVPPQEVHLYSWRGPYDKALDAVEKEMLARGFERMEMPGTPEGSIAWTIDNDACQVLIQRGKNETANQWARGKGTDLDTWVTVLTMEDLPDNWMTELRCWFRGLDW